MLAKMVHSQEPFPLRQWQKKPKPRNRYRIPVQNAVATHSTSVLQMSALPAVEPSTVVLLVLGAPETDSTLSSSTGGAGVKVSHIHSFSARKSSPTHKLHTAQQSWLCSSHGLLSHACTGTSSCSARLATRGRRNARPCTRNSTANDTDETCHPRKELHARRRGETCDKAHCNSTMVTGDRHWSEKTS